MKQLKEKLEISWLSNGLSINKGKLLSYLYLFQVFEVKNLCLNNNL